jgi:hypothetical protein
MEEESQTKTDSSKSQATEYPSPPKQLIQVIFGFCIAIIVYFLTAEFVNPDFNSALRVNPNDFSHLMIFYYYGLSSIYIFFVFPKWAKWTKRSQTIIGYPVAFTILIFPRVLSFFINQNIATWASLLPCGSIFMTFIRSALEPNQTESMQPKIEKTTVGLKKEFGISLGLHGSFLYCVLIASIIEYGLICVTSIPMSYVFLSPEYVFTLAFILTTSFCFGYFSKNLSKSLLSFLENQTVKDDQIQDIRHAFLIRGLLGPIIFGIWLYFVSNFFSLTFLVESLFFIPIVDFSFLVDEYILLVIFIVFIGVIIGKFLVTKWWNNLTEENLKKWRDVISVHSPETYEIFLSSVTSGLFRTIIYQHTLIMSINFLITLGFPFPIRLGVYAVVSFLFLLLLGNSIRIRSAMTGFDPKTMLVIGTSTFLSPIFSISVEATFRYFRAKLLKDFYDSSAESHLPPFSETVSEN